MLFVVKKVLNFLRCLALTVFVILNNLYVIPAYFVWVFIFYPFTYIAWDLYWVIEAVLFKGLLGMVASWYYISGHSLIECGDDVSALYDQEAVLMSNHQSTSDIPIIMALVQSQFLQNSIMWVMDAMFKFTNFGLISMFRGDFFIIQGKKGRSDQLDRLEEHLKSVYISHKKKWIALWPEGGFLRKRRAASIRFAKKNNFPELQHVTLPRIGALKTILDTLCARPQDDQPNGSITQGIGGAKFPHIKWIIDVTVAYPNAEPLSLHGIISGYYSPRTVLAHYRAYPISSIPYDEKGLTTWLYERYAEKEKFLDDFYKTGKMSTVLDQEERHMPLRKCISPLQIDILSMLFYHTFFLLSTYIQYFYLLKPVFNFVFS